jgi:hypothetical protein
MLKYVFAAAFATMCATPADAQTLPPVESMNCDQMMAEMTVAGQVMSSQLDPEFAAEAQRMQNEQQEAYNNRPSVAAGIGAGIACSLPGVAYACMATNAAQAQQAQSQADQNIARMSAQNDRLQASMAGLDQQRMMAISDRFEQQQCQVPQQ